MIRLTEKDNSLHGIKKGRSRKVVPHPASIRNFEFLKIYHGWPNSSRSETLRTGLKSEFDPVVMEAIEVCVKESARSIQL